MNIDAFRQCRNSIHKHLVSRLVDRDIPIDYAAIVRLENRLEQMRPAFEQPGRKRYRLTCVLGRDQHFSVVYDTEFRCLLTIWRQRPHSVRVAA